ncbi:Predicted O-methyltransferase YrrM [Williamsia sterculiae]|uniref:Predicted O-methyltransferase YrrM n=1 Tax=Williamsia sterculiae TaxID=1344003 RepID=A0A1N7H5J5_9NOCA|nr:Predicted O-methyltransferase YrrM [Williamsia sterculiae]
MAARPVTPTTIVAAELDRICADLDRFEGIEPATTARLRRVRDIAAGLDPYLDGCTSPESPALADLARSTREIDWDADDAADGFVEKEMLSGHVEGRLLRFLVTMTRATRVLEIGVFTGYSALAMAEALPREGSVVACELDRKVAGRARELLNASVAGKRVTIEVGPATDTLRRLASQSRSGPDSRFDLVFIDADKAGYIDYLNTLLDSDLLTDHAVIAVDNTLLQGEPYLVAESRSTNGAAIAEFNEVVAADPRVEQVLIPVRDGLTLIRRLAPATGER